MRAVLLDTNIVHRPRLLAVVRQKVEAGLIEAFIPTIVHAERVRQLAEKEGLAFSLRVIQTYFRNNPIRFLDFSREDAEAVAEVWLRLKQEQAYTERDWRIHRFDILLCAVSLSRQMILVTDDIRGKHFNVLPPEQKMSSTELELWA